MTSLRKAGIIDIGSNSIRYLEAICSYKVLTFSPKQLETTRLAAGLDTCGNLSEDAMFRSICAIEKFVNISRENKSAYLFIYATSAVRDAKNGNQFSKLIQKQVGLVVDVLSCEREAIYAYKGAVGTLGGGFVELGGGSAQIVTKAAVESFPIGCIRARDAFCGLELEQLQCLISPWVSNHLKHAKLYNEERWAGAGGTITTLAALEAGLLHYDAALVNNTELTQSALQALIYRLALMGEKRSSHPLLLERHDIILYGAAVLLELMRLLNINTLHASDADGMEGYIREKLSCLL